MTAYRSCAALLAAALALPAAAQAPVFIHLTGVSTATDLTKTSQVIVVGQNGANAYRWTQTGGAVDIGPATGNIRISTDGSTIVADTVGMDGIRRASYWDGSTWTQLPGLGAVSGTTETTVYGVNGDGTAIVGLAWVTAGSAHAFRWDPVNGTVDLGSTVPGKSTRANGVSGDGLTVVGWQDSLAGSRQGARWDSGVQALFTYTDPMMQTFLCGEAQAANTDGSFVVGFRLFGGPAAAWIWDRGANQVALLPNAPGESGTPFALDVTDDGSIVVGGNGGAPVFNSKGVIWINGVPQSFIAYLASIGTANLAGITETANAVAITRDGTAICGTGAGPAFGGPGAWLVILEDSGAPFCAGDGLDTNVTTSCPCLNFGAVGRGCANSANPSGAVLSASGNTNPDEVVLAASGMPATVSCIYLQGDALTDTVFGDGVRCAGGQLIRLRTKTNVAGASTFPDSTDTVTVSQRGMVLPGSGVTRHYQTYYRNAAAAFCPPATFNVTNGWTIDW